MNILITIIIAAIVSYIAYWIALKLPFLVEFAGLIGVVVFLLVVWRGYATDWHFPLRR